MHSNGLDEHTSAAWSLQFKEDFKFEGDEVLNINLKHQSSDKVLYSENINLKDDSWPLVELGNLEVQDKCAPQDLPEI